jgi:hypothetical protein
MAREFHPTGQVTMGGSVLVDADNYSSDHDNGVKLVGTLADKRGLPVDGMRQVTVTWDMMVTNEGPEVEVVAAVESALRAQVGFKFPVQGVNLLMNITFSKVKVAQKLGDALILSCTGMGHVADSQGI